MVLYGILWYYMVLYGIYIYIYIYILYSWYYWYQVTPTAAAAAATTTAATAASQQLSQPVKAQGGITHRDQISRSGNPSL